MPVCRAWCTLALSDLNAGDAAWMELRADSQAPGGAGRALTHLPIIQVKTGGAEGGCWGNRAGQHLCWGEPGSLLSLLTIVIVAITTDDCLGLNCL